MKSTRNTISCVIALASAILVGIGCNQGSPSDVRAGNTVAANAPVQTASNLAPTSSKDISGNYTVTGQNEGGGGKYAGDLTITKRDEVYQFSWSSGDKTYDGVGVQGGNSVGVSFTEGDDGQGCGVILYQIKSDGNLDGKFGYWGINEAQTETATRTSGTDLEGGYNVRGSNPDGTSYEGKLNVKKQGAGYSFEWNTGNTSTGFGIRGANMIAVGFGGSKCGFVGYDVIADGSLQGKWGSAGSTDVGTETAKKE
ncbi:MAG: hypothetical protein PSX80_07735 [bacterium]|nr:hypothetical protein [bacterium]